MKSNQRFDEIISNKLNSLSSELDKDAWTVFENAMNADTDLNMLDQDMSFDDTIREKFNRIPHSTAPSAHWMQLKELLETIAVRKTEIYSSRIMEVFAVLVIILSLHYWMERKWIQPADKDTAIEIAHIIQPTQNRSDFDKKENVDISFSHSNLISKSNKPLLPVYSKSENSKASIITSDVVNVAVNTDRFETQQMEQNNDNLASNSDLGISANSSEMVTFSDFDTQENFSLSLIESTGSTHYSYKAEEFDVHINNGQASFSVFNQLPEVLNDNDVWVANKNAVQMSAAIFYATDINLINTPFDKVYSVASYSKEALNTSFGAALTYKTGNVSWEGGLRYAHLTYSPQIIKEEHNQFADRYFETSLDRITFNILTTQFLIKYHIFDARELNVYLAAGTGLNFITDSNFEITTNIRQGRTGNRSSDQDLRLIEEKNFNQGLFEGGRLRENYFVTGAVGFGVEKFLFGNFSMFTQAVYNRHLLSADLGIGPNKDKIHTLSLQGGLRFNLH